MITAPGTNPIQLEDRYIRYLLLLFIIIGS